MFISKKLMPAITQAAKAAASRPAAAPASAPPGFKAMSNVVPKVVASAAKSMVGRRMKTGGKAKKINY